MRAGLHVRGPNGWVYCGTKEDRLSVVGGLLKTDKAKKSLQLLHEKHPAAIIDWDPKRSCARLVISKDEILEVQD